MTALKPLLFLLGLLLLASTSLAAQSDPQALSLLHKSEQLLRSQATESTYRVNIVRPDWRRTMRFRSQDDRAHDRARMEILEPAKSKGTVFLKVGNKLSMYLPKLRREIGISPAMMLDPWMGSDFNNQDLLEATSFIDDYTHRVIGREGQGDSAVVTIESVPKPQSTVTWARLVQKIRTDGLPLQVDYYDSQGRIVRRLEFKDPGPMGGRVIPTRWVMTPLDRPAQHTEIIMEDVHFNADIPDALFQPQTGGAAPK